MPPVRQPMAPVTATTPGQRNEARSDLECLTDQSRKCAMGVRKSVKSGDVSRLMTVHL